MNQYRTGGAQLVIPGYGLQVIQPRQQAGEVAAADWYTAGGAPAPVAAYQAIGAADLAASYVNLANPGTYDAVVGSTSAPVFDTATGWAFNGSINSRYLKTGIIPAAGWSMIARFSDVTSLTNVVAGMQGSGNTRFYLAPNFGGIKTYGYGGFVQIAPGLALGTVAIAATSCYANGALVGATVAGTFAPYDIHIGGRNTSGNMAGALDGKIQAVAIYNTTLDAAMVAAVHAAMMALA